MPLETGTYISDLNPANPSSVDPTSQGDDHLRLVKHTIKQTFPNLTGAMTANQAQLNKMVTVTASDEELNRTIGLTEDLTTTHAAINAAIQANGDRLDSLEATPAGSIIMFAGASAPTGWVLCDGQALDRTANAALFAAIGTTYGAGDGSTTFNVPDARDRFPRAAGTDYTLAATHDSQNKAHTHSVTASGSTSTNGNHQHSINTAGGSRLFNHSGSGDTAFATIPGSVNTTSKGNHSHSVSVSGTAASSGASEAMPKGIVFNFIIKL